MEAPSMQETSDAASTTSIVQEKKMHTIISDTVNGTDGVTATEAWSIEISHDEPSSRKWKKPSETMTLVNHFLSEGLTPKQVLSHILPQYSVPDTMTDEFAIQVILELFNERQTRTKLPQYNTFEDAVELFRTRKNILVLTGAGVSVSCGIPDFRSANGIYARLHRDFPELPDPQAMFDIEFFRKNPAPFYNFAKEIFPGQFKPSVSHMFIKFLEESGRLLRNYTQNIDTLEQIAGIERVIECHGSFSRSICLNCKHEVDSAEIKNDVLEKRVAYCRQCDGGVMKPNIVFFGEDLGERFHDAMGEDHDKVDLLVVIGSSLKVRPVALIPYNVEADVPQILINRERLTRYDADVKLLGNCDDIILALCLAIGGEIRDKMLAELETRSEQFPEYLERYRAAVSSETPIMQQTLSIKDFKMMINAKDDAPAAKRRRHVIADSDDTLNDGRVESVVENAAVSAIINAASAKSKLDEPTVKTTKLVVENNLETAEAPTNIFAEINNATSPIAATSSFTDCCYSTTTTTATESPASISSSSVIVQQRSTNKMNDDGLNASFWESNYVDVQSALPFNTTLFIPSNLTIFKGAELFYDRDSEAFCRRPGPVIKRYYDDETTVVSTSASSQQQQQQTNELNSSASEDEGETGEDDTDNDDIDDDDDNDDDDNDNDNDNDNNDDEDDDDDNDGGDTSQTDATPLKTAEMTS